MYGIEQVSMEMS